MDSKHTQGAWKLQPIDGGFNIADQTRNWDICTITTRYAPSAEEAEANALLLSAAPKILAALERLLAQCDRLRLPGQPESNAEKAARAIIDEATGAA